MDSKLDRCRKLDSECDCIAPDPSVLLLNFPPEGSNNGDIRYENDSAEIYLQHFRPNAVSVALVCNDRILCIERNKDPGIGQISIPGGRVDRADICQAQQWLREVGFSIHDETTQPEHIEFMYWWLQSVYAGLRELLEEAGIVLERMRDIVEGGVYFDLPRYGYFYDNDPVSINLLILLVRVDEEFEPTSGSDAVNAAWRSVRDVKEFQGGVCTPALEGILPHLI